MLVMMTPQNIVVWSGLIFFYGFGTLTNFSPYVNRNLAFSHSMLDSGALLLDKSEQ